MAYSQANSRITAYQAAIARLENLRDKCSRDDDCIIEHEKKDLLSNADRQLIRSRKALDRLKNAKEGEEKKKQLVEFLKVYRDLRSVYFEILKEKDLTQK